MPTFFLGSTKYTYFFSPFESKLQPFADFWIFFQTNTKSRQEQLLAPTNVGRLHALHDVTPLSTDLRSVLQKSADLERRFLDASAKDEKGVRKTLVFRAKTLLISLVSLETHFLGQKTCLLESICLIPGDRQAQLVAPLPEVCRDPVGADGRAQQHLGGVGLLRLALRAAVDRPGKAGPLLLSCPRIDIAGTCLLLSQYNKVLEDFHADPDQRSLIHGNKNRAAHFHENFSPTFLHVIK